MDYSIGSLSDLITGSNTASKVKVVTKKVIEKITRTEFSVPTPHDDVEKPQKIAKQSLNEGKFNEYDNQIQNNWINSEESSQNNETWNRPKRGKKRNNDNGPRTFPKKARIQEGPRNVEPTENPERYDPETANRTIFVGNLPLSATKDKVQKLFSKYGKVQAIWFRGVPVADPKIPKKVAAIKKEFHPKRNSFFGYVKFATQEEAQNAKEVDTTLYEGHHLRIHILGENMKHDGNKAIFVGNLSFDAEEDDLWQLFEPCGVISSVRVVRSPLTGMGKGFAYVNFQSPDSVTLASDMEVKLHNRQLRISTYNTKSGKKPKSDTKGNEDRPERPPRPKKVKKSPQETNFQGATFKPKKKHSKLNKGLLHKKKLAKKIAPK